MEILKIVHEDFDLIVECTKFEETFKKAQKKQDNIMESTSYSVNEGEIHLYNSVSRSLSLYQVEKTYPVIFENKDYFIGIEFKNKNLISKPHIHSRMKEIESKFYYKEHLGFLSGTVNFGNDLGKSNLILRYLKNGSDKEIIFYCEVFPTKLNYKSDYEKIINDIENEYQYLVLDFLRKTYTSFKSGISPNTDLIWWQVFGGLYKDFLSSSKYILNKPHSRIITSSRLLTADRIKNWTSALEEEYSEFKTQPGKVYLSKYKSLSMNTPENRFLKHAVFNTLRRYKKVKTFIEEKFSTFVSVSFKEEILSVEKQLKTVSQNPFFKNIDIFTGIKQQESLVLQKATYKCWIMLNSGLKFLDGIQKIELKNIAELYQIWSFLEMKKVLQNLLGKDKADDIELAKITIVDFVFKIERGVKSRVSFVRDNGERIDLYHDFAYNISSDSNERSYTVKQKPDIVLRITKNDLKENYIMTYLYDAKYRLSSDETEGAPDLPTEDAINQMHRYRDAIYYVNKESTRPEKEIIGAYILFPGSGDVDTIKNLDYYKSISSVNIGAFPLKPNDYINRKLLEEHLKEIIGIDTESVLNEIAPHKQTRYEDPNPGVLIGVVKKGIHSFYFETEGELLYHTGKVKPSQIHEEDSDYLEIKTGIKYFAPYISEKGVREFFEITSYKTLPRNEIFPQGHSLYKQDDFSERLVIKLGKKHLIKNGMYFTCSIRIYRYTKLFNIKNPINGKIEFIIN